MTGDTFMSKRATRSILGTAVCLLVLALPSCESSDTIPPDGSEITLSANPAQIILLTGTQSSPVDILATVRNGLGVPLPGQDVRFTTSSGVLTPVAGTSVETDDDGNALSVLNGAKVGPTITATSGTATAQLTLTATTGQLAAIILSPDPLILDGCSQKSFDLTATALNPNGDPVAGVTLFFEFVTSGPTEVTGTFTPSGGVSADDTGTAPDPEEGEVKTRLDINETTCLDLCIGADCTATIRVRDQGGTIFSNIVTIQDQVS
jgi:hypothetical protein